MIDSLIYFAALLFVRALQLLPLGWVARLGRLGGGLAYYLDVSHRRVAKENLRACFPEKSASEIKAIAFENFKRIGESYACGVKTAGMTFEKLKPHVDFISSDKMLPQPHELNPSRVVAIGHFGNFELYARFGQFAPVFQCMTTYRGLEPPALNRILQSLREKSGCLYFERRTDGAALKAAMNGPGKMLGLLCDQHAGRGGLRLPFFGRDSSTSSAPAVFALRYDCRLFCGFCYRTAPGQWRLEVGDEIATRENGRPRATSDIMLDVNRAFEEAVRRDPANWFWVHKRWKPSSTTAPTPVAPAAKDEPSHA